MRLVLRLVLIVSLVLAGLGPVQADPPQPSPAPVLGQEDLAWLQAQEHFVVGVRAGQVPLVFDTGSGMLARHLHRLSGAPVG